MVISGTVVYSISQITISKEAVITLNQFAQNVGLLSGPVPYEQVVATQFAPLWKG